MAERKVYALPAGHDEVLSRYGYAAYLAQLFEECVGSLAEQFRLAAMASGKPPAEPTRQEALRQFPALAEGRRTEGGDAPAS